MKKHVMVMAAALVCAAVLADPVIRPLSMQEMGRFGATDALLIRASDLTEDDDNVAQTNTVTLTGPCAYEYVGLLVDTPFDTTLSTNALSSTLTVLIGSDTVINAVQIANDTWRPYKAAWAGPPTVTTSGPDTNALVSAYSAPYKGTVTNGATATITTIVTGPNASVSLEDVDSGQARVFFRILR